MSSLFAPRALAKESGSSDASFIQAATALVEQAEREDKFWGVILVARGDKVLLRKAAGFANLSSDLRNSVDTPFPIESITKQFTGAAVMMLVEDGKIALDDPISKFYAETPPEWAGITILRLLTHSSGIGDQLFNAARLEGTMQYLGTHDDIVPLLAAIPLLFQPGSGFQYSNTGYVLLAGVITRATGEPYEKFLADRIFVPLGMYHTGFHLRPDLKGYTPSPTGELREAPNFGEAAGPDGAGGIYSMADDMLIWSRAWDNGKILSAASRSAALTDYGHDYGFG